MPDDLLDHLPALAPQVGSEAARRALADVRATAHRRRRTRRRASVAAALLVGTALAAATMSAIRGDGDGRPVITTGPSDRTAYATTVPVGAFEATLTLQTGRVEIGGATPVEVRVRNASTEPQTLFEFGHCAGPLVADTDAATADRPPTWDGTSPLLDLLRDPAVALRPSAVLAGRVGLAVAGCDLSLKVDTVQPGDERTWTGLLDGRVGPQASGNVVLRVSLSFGVDPRSAGEAIPVPTVSKPIRLPTVDAAGRTTSTERALAALATSPYVQQFVDATRHPTGLPSGMVQQWVPSVAWWDGAWELRLRSGVAQVQVLRLRYDPATDAVVDARILNGCPDDERACSDPIPQPDQVLAAP